VVEVNVSDSGVNDKELLLRERVTEFNGGKDNLTQTGADCTPTSNPLCREDASTVKVRLEIEGIANGIGG